MLLKILFMWESCREITLVDSLTQFIDTRVQKIYASRTLPSRFVDDRIESNLTRPSRRPPAIIGPRRL